MNYKVKHIIDFILLFVYAIGVLGGFGYTLSSKGGGFTAVCILVLGGLAFPTVKRIFDDLRN